MLSEKTYLELLVPFYNVVKRELRSSDDLAYYGTGEAAHWSIQSNFNVAGALGVLGTAAADIGLDKSEILELALTLFRYNLATHKTGTEKCSCGGQWGNSWITVLGMERMTAAQLVMEPFFSDTDREMFRKVRLDEADWLLTGYPVVAGVDGLSGRNKPESSFWNGSFLFRTALDYPDAPNKDEYLEKSCALLLNAISHPLDAVSEKLFHNRPLKDWNVGYNFTENYSLDHHGYMNIGYSIITLSHAAYLYFYCLERRWEFPAEAALHVKDLWEVVKNFIFPDGRLLRIGGDTRARYCYCQMYLLPVLLMMEHLYNEKASASWEQGMIGILKKEQLCNPDGSFFGTRLADMSYQSRYYYTRLESDPFAVLGAAAAIRRNHTLLQPENAPSCPAAEWHDDYHGADLIRDEKNIRSMVRGGGEGPVVLALPLDSSDMAEWGGNGFSHLQGHAISAKPLSSWHRSFPGGFLNSGSSSWIENGPYGEGEGAYPVAISRSACAALPDGCTMVILEKTEVIKEHSLLSLRASAWQIPNDLHNGNKRSFKGEKFSALLEKHSGRGVIETNSRWINLEEKVTLCLGYGADSWKIHAPIESLSVIKSCRCMTSLYINEICTKIEHAPNTRRMPGAILADSGYSVTIGASSQDGEIVPVRRLEAPESARSVEVTDRSGIRWCFTANFGAGALTWNGNIIPPGECHLQQL